MKYLNKTMVFFLFMLVSFGVDISAYTYRFANMTDRTVKVKLRYFFGDLNEKDKQINAYDQAKLSFRNLNCLQEIVVSSFDKKKNKRVTGTARIKHIGKRKYTKMEKAINKFEESVREVGKTAALKGPAGTTLKAKIDGLVSATATTQAHKSVNLCKSKNFILVLDYGKMYALKK